MVTAVLDKSFDVLMPQFGSVYRVYCKVSKQCVMGSHDHDFFQDLPLQSFHFEVIEETQLTCLSSQVSIDYTSSVLPVIPDKSVCTDALVYPSSSEDHILLLYIKKRKRKREGKERRERG